MAKLAVLAVLASLVGAVSCEFSIYIGWGYPPPNSGRPYPLPPACSPLSPTGLKIGYYANKNCPNTEKIVREAVEKADAGVQAGLVRLLFHDCFVRVPTHPLNNERSTIPFF
jgi:peroxidase